MEFKSLYKVTRDEASAEFFDGTAKGILLVQQCENGHYLPPAQGHGPTVRCPVCLTDVISWVPASGAATLVSWVIPHARSGEPTSVAGIVELAEGPWMNALIDAEPTASLFVGQPLTAVFIPTDGEVLPGFRPVS
jgi:uncharacterized protein